MRRARCFVGIACLLLATTAQGLAAESPRAKEAKIEKVSGGYRFTEGPAADTKGNLYFSDIPNQRIHRMDAITGKITVFQAASGRSNGLAFDARDRLLACEGGARRVVRYEPGDDGALERVVLADRWKGKRLNSPNDLALDAHGGLYFTDPRYGSQEGRELEGEAVYYVAADRSITRVITDRVKPNGILLSADGKTLYVADNRRKSVWAYPVARAGKPGKGALFASLDPAGRGGPDGMTLDVEGRVYCAGQGKVWVWDAKGVLVDKITFPEGPSNCTFGGKDRKTLYVTARTSLYRLSMRVKGR